LPLYLCFFFALRERKKRNTKGNVTGFIVSQVEQSVKLWF
jgi:hypothetical protein